MFEAAELGRKIPKDEFAALVPDLRIELLEVQQELRKAPFPVIVVMAGVALGKHAPELATDSPPQALRIPHPGWMDEARVKNALRDSHRRRLVGRH